MSKTIIMRPPFYGVTADSIDISKEIKKPFMFDSMPKYRIHPMDLPGWRNNPDLDKELLEYNSKAADREIFSNKYFEYEAYLMFKSRFVKNFESHQSRCNKIIHRYKKYFREYEQFKERSS